MTTFSLTVPNDNIKTKFKDILKEVIDENPDIETQYEALEIIFKVFKEGIDSIFIKKESSSVQQVLNSVECPFLEYEEFDFKCFEHMDKKKKPNILGTDPERILIRCQKCKDGKAQKIIEQYQKKLRGQNIRGIVQMIKTFEAFAEKGVPSTIHFCNRIKGKQVMTGTKTIICTKHDSRVSIDPTCIDPLCPHYEKYSIYVSQEFPRETLALIEGIAEDYQRIEDLTSQKPKDIESEVIE